MKYALVLSDNHSGHGAGLTPPKYWRESIKSEDPHMAKKALILKTIWEFWNDIASSRKWDYLLHIGDAIDGKGEASGGIEQLTTDRQIQVEMATEAISCARAKTIRMVRGTPYHVGKEDNFEDFIARNVGAEIKDHMFLNINDVTLDLKHKIGGSSIPHGSGTALLKAKLWAALWAERGLAPNPDIIIRGHVHYHLLIKDFHKTQFTAPCLQWDSRYGKLNCERTIDLGVMEIAFGDGTYEIIPHQLDMRFARAEAEVI